MSDRRTTEAQLFAQVETALVTLAESLNTLSKNRVVLPSYVPLVVAFLGELQTDTLHQKGARILCEQSILAPYNKDRRDVVREKIVQAGGIPSLVRMLHVDRPPPTRAHARRGGREGGGTGGGTRAGDGRRGGWEGEKT